MLVEWVADNRSLARACNDVAGVLALDTEFMRTNTYYPVPGLYQIATHDRVLLIDPQAITEWQPLRDLLTDPSIVKIMHACLEDLELLHHHLGVQLSGVFDTQYANAFLTEKFSLSYAGLVEDRLGVALPKHETRSNWLKRPLTEEQFEYAVEDVVHLLALYRELHVELDRRERLPWFLSDMAERECYEPVRPSEYYRNSKRGWQLSDRQLGVFQSLCHWREETAQAENVPRNRVVWDEHLFKFAKVGALSEAHVRDALPAGVARRYGAAIIAASRRRVEPVPEPIPGPLSSSQGVLVKELRAVGLSFAADLNLAPELLCRKRDLEECVRVHSDRGGLPDMFASWRAGVVGHAYLQILDDASARVRGRDGGG